MIGKRYEYDVMAQCERDLWWYKCLHELTVNKIRKYSPGNPIILDAGCGTGGMIEKLGTSGYTTVVGFDLSKDAIEYASLKGADAQILNILDAGTAYKSNSFDVIICNDILTVLPLGKDRIAMESLISLLKPGGFLFINLAARNEFRGTHDIAVAMTKRYTKADIKELAHGLAEIKEITHWPFILSPIIYTIRFFQRTRQAKVNNDRPLKSDVRPIAPLLNSIFYTLTSLEHKVKGSKPWGSSLFTVMQKPL